MANTFLEVFTYSSPFGMGPAFELYFEGRISFPDPRGYSAWGGLGFVFERTVLGSTKLRMYAPLAGELFYGPTGLFRIFPSLGPAIGTTAVAIAAAVGVGYVLHPSTKAQMMRSYSRGQSQPPSGTGSFYIP